MLDTVIRPYNFQGKQFTIKNYDRSATDLYVDAPLTNLSIAYRNTDYIADLAVPRIPVTQETGIIWKMGKENFSLKTIARADKAKSLRSGYTVDSSSLTYRLVTYALSDVVTKGMMDMAVSPMQPEADATDYLTEQLALNKEYLLASALFNTGASGFSGYTETLNAGSSRYQWNDYTNSNPIDDVRHAINDHISANSGATSDFAIIMGGDVWTKLEDHPDILDRIKYTQTGIVTQDLVKTIMGVSNIYVGNAMYNSAAEGQTTSLSRVWGKYVLVMHRGRPAIKTAACAAILHGGNVVRKWTDNELRGATVIEAEEALQAKVLSTASAYLYSTAVA